MEKKTKIIIGVVSGLILLLIVVLVINTNNKSRRIEEYITNRGFVKSSYLYTKLISDDDLDEYNNNVEMGVETEYEALHFSTNSYVLTKDKMTYKNGIDKNFTGYYDYKDDSLTYTYRINYNNTNIFVEGLLDKKTDIFTCDVTFAYNIDIQGSKDDICNKVELETKMFKYDVVTLISDPGLLEYMRDK